MKKEKGRRGGRQGSYCKLRAVVNLDKRRSTSLHYDICAEAKASAFFWLDSQLAENELFANK